MVEATALATKHWNEQNLDANQDGFITMDEVPEGYEIIYQAMEVTMQKSQFTVEDLAQSYMHSSIHEVAHTTTCDPANVMVTADATMMA